MKATVVSHCHWVNAALHPAVIVDSAEKWERSRDACMLVCAMQPFLAAHIPFQLRATTLNSRTQALPDKCKVSVKAIVRNHIYGRS